jgi:hypothetical protein
VEPALVPGDPDSQSEGGGTHRRPEP